MYNKLNLMDTDIALKTMDVDLTIPAENTQDAFQALCNLNAYNDLKSGCIFSARKLIKPKDSTSLAEDPSVRFINMPWNYDEVCETVEEILELLNFSVEKDLEGDVHIFSFASTHGGDEEVFVEALAPFVKPGSFIEWQADNGEVWRNDFVQKKMITSTGEVSWTVNAMQLCKGKDAQQCWGDYGYYFALDKNNSYSLYIKESAGLDKVLNHCGLEFTDITQEEVALSNSMVVL